MSPCLACVAYFARLVSVARFVRFLACVAYFARLVSVARFVRFTCAVRFVLLFSASSWSWLY